MNETCRECGGKCCSFREMRISFTTLEEERLEEHISQEEVVEQLVFEDGEVPEMQWYLLTYPSGHEVLAFECEHREEGLCTEYERRPSMCSFFECEALREEETSLEEYLERTEWDDGEFEEVEKEEVTETVRRILKEEAEGREWN